MDEIRDTETTDFGKSRMEALTDGIFAIAMTILVLTIEVPPLPKHPTDGEVWKAVASVYPAVLAYAASFITLGIYWVGHHSAFRYIVKSDRMVLWLNMYFLMFVALVPFTTNLYSGDADSRITNTIFGANLIILGLLTYWIWDYSGRHKFLAEDVTGAFRKRVATRTLIGPMLATTALLVSLIQPIWAEVIYFMMIPVFMATVRRLEVPWHHHREKS